MQAHAAEHAEAPVVGVEIDCTVVAGRGLVAKDRSLLGKKSSDPFVVISCGKLPPTSFSHRACDFRVVEEFMGPGFSDDLMAMMRTIFVKNHRDRASLAGPPRGGRHAHMY